LETIATASETRRWLKSIRPRALQSKGRSRPLSKKWRRRSRSRSKTNQSLWAWPRSTTRFWLTVSIKTDARQRTLLNYRKRRKSKSRSSRYETNYMN
jgi:hypothetical protein